MTVRGRTSEHHHQMCSAMFKHEAKPSPNPTPKRHTVSSRWHRCLRGLWKVMLACLVIHAQTARGQELGVPAALTPLSGASGEPLPKPWRFAGLPGQTLPATRFTLERLEGRAVLRVQAKASYGNLLHPWTPATAGYLRWRWRVDQPLKSSDLRRREGDDVALKVCALFDMPLGAVPFWERQVFRLAESRSGEKLPTATLCYVWDPSFAPNTVVVNAFSARVRYVTLGAAPGVWQEVQRDLAADFLRAFGEETRTVPTLSAIGVGADADNTRGESLGWVTDLEWSADGRVVKNPGMPDDSAPASPKR